ncbi:MAG: hypothetical protein KAJ75_03830 [Alphaproteobacteria bacterium]|nr:hypothetical protein [Alphaproteobacteria bacterium]
MYRLLAVFILMVLTAPVIAEEAAPVIEALESKSVFLPSMTIPLKKSRRYPSYVEITIKVTPSYDNFDMFCSATPHVFEKFLIALNEKPIDGRMLAKGDLSSANEMLKKTANEYFKSNTISHVEIISGTLRLKKEEKKLSKECNY